MPVLLRVTPESVLSTKKERWSRRGEVGFCWRHLQWDVQRESRKAQVLRENLCSAEILGGTHAHTCGTVEFHPQTGSVGEVWCVFYLVIVAKRPLLLVAQKENRPCVFLESETSCVPCMGGEVSGKAVPRQSVPVPWGTC